MGAAESLMVWTPGTVSRCKELFSEKNEGGKIMIKLIASDLDGTLLPEGTADINPKIYEVILKLQAAGVTFVAASGRNYESVMSVFGHMEKELTVISDNGGYGAKGGIGMYCNGFPKELLREVVSAVREVRGAWMMASAARGIYTDRNDPKYIDWMRKGYKQNIRLVDDLLEVEEPLIKVALYTYEEEASFIAAPLRERFGARAVVALAGERWIDITIPGASKGAALERIQNTLGISPEETAAFGDNGNDISMLKRAAESYAVANARDEVKAVAKHVLTDTSDHAVLDVLEALLMQAKR